MCSVAFDLLFRGNGAEDNFCKLSRSKGLVGYPADDLQRSLYYRNGYMSAVVDETCDVVLWHFGELLLEDAFEASENGGALIPPVIVDNLKLDLSVSLFDHCRLR